MEVAFDVNELEGMKRAELQKLCKSIGIKANMKVGDSCTQSKDQSVVVYSTWIELKQRMCQLTLCEKSLECVINSYHLWLAPEKNAFLRVTIEYIFNFIVMVCIQSATLRAGAFRSSQISREEEDRKASSRKVVVSELLDAFTGYYCYISYISLVACENIRYVPSGEERGETDVFAGYIYGSL